MPAIFLWNSIPKGTVILKQFGPPSDSVKVIKKGGVEVLMRSDTGEDVVMDYKGEGDNFGFLSLIGKDKQRTTVVAIEDTICYVLNKETVYKLMETSPAFNEYFLAYLSQYVDKTYQEMHDKSLFYGSSDRYLFATSVGEVAHEAITIAEQTSIQEAAQIMVSHKISSLIVVDRNSICPKGLSPTGTFGKRWWPKAGRHRIPSRISSAFLSSGWKPTNPALKPC